MKLSIEETINEIARNLRMSPSEVSKSIHKLIAKGLFVQNTDGTISIDTEKGYSVERE